MAGRRSRRGDGEPVVVVGAGPAGLAAAGALRSRGIPSLVLERGPGAGTSWRQRHEELRLNTSRRLSSLRRPGIPRSAGRWVSRDDYVAHLAAFAAARRLDLRCGVTVTAVERAHPGWRVRTSAGDHWAGDVVVATGQERVPHLPHWPGRDAFAPPLAHTAEVRRVADLAGRRVLLVGAGNSGVEMAELLVGVGVAELWLSVRTPPTILPLELLGLPLDLIGVTTRFMPERVRDVNARLISRLTIGDLARYGLPPPPVGPYARLRTTGVTVAVDRGFARHVRAGRIEVVPEVERLSGTEVVLRGGRVLRPDVVVAATGFRPGLEPLVGQLGVLDGNGHPLTEPGRATPGAPGLWFIGYWKALEGSLRRHRPEARRVARAIARSRSRREDG